MNVKAVIFSKSRPLQLEACLHSLYSNCLDLDQIQVAVLAKTEGFYTDAYDRVMRDYPDVVFIREADFHTDLCHWMKGADYGLFVVDDCLFYRPFRVMEAVNLLAANASVIAFSLRLGKNITRSYVADREIQQPEFDVDSGNLLWRWRGADSDWGYPLEVSSTIMQVGPNLELYRFGNPNELEDVLSQEPQYHFGYNYMMSFEQSVAYCVPANIVNTTHTTNRHGANEAFNATNLLDAYMHGQRIDISHLPTPSAVHQEIEFELWKPRYSVVIPYHEAGKTIIDTILSVMTQTVQDLELIVVDDGSDPNDFIHCFPFWKNHRMRYYRIENSGPTKATAYGFERAYGDYLLRLDADDLMDHDFLKIMGAALDAHPEAGFVYCNTYYFGDGLKLFEQREYDFQQLLKENFISYCSLIRRAAYEKADGYDLDNWGYSEDWQLWIKLGAAGFPGVHVPQALFYYRQGAGIFHKVNPLLSRAFIITRLPHLWPKEEVEQAERTLEQAPNGWYGRPPGELTS